MNGLVKLSLLGILFAFVLGMPVYCYNSTAIPLGIYCVLYWLAVPVFSLLLLQGPLAISQAKEDIARCDERYGEYPLSHTSCMADASVHLKDARLWVNAGVAFLILTFAANNLMLFLADAWSVQLAGWMHFTLRFWNIVFGGILGFLAHYIDAVIAAIAGSNIHPLTSFLQGIWEGLRPDPALIESAKTNGVSVVFSSGKFLANFALTVLSGVLSGLVMKWMTSRDKT